MKHPEPSFLGTGWSFPPTFSRPTSCVDMVSGEADIRESLWILFSTALGERLMLPQYGCQLWDMVFQSLTTTFIRELQQLVGQAILQWEPRIDVNDVLVQPDAQQEGLVSIAVEYTIRKTNSRSNLVYPFYIREGNLVLQAS